MSFWNWLFGGGEPRGSGETKSDANADDSAAAPVPTPQRGFVELALDVASQLESVVRAEAPRELELLLHCEDSEQPRRIDLHSVFAETRDLDPAEVRARVLRFLEVCLSPPSLPESLQQARELLIPLLRPHHYFGCGPDARPIINVQRTFVSPLDEVLGVRLNGAVGFVDPARLKRWGVSVEQAFEQARRNLERLTREDVWVQKQDGILELTCKDPHAASRLLLADWWKRLADTFRGQPAVVVPSETRVLAAPCMAAPAVDRLARIAQREHLAAARPISPAVYAPTPDYDVFVLDYHALDDALSRDLAAAALSFACAQYDRQAEAVNAVLETGLSSHGNAALTPAFVPRVIAVSNDQGIATSAIVMGGIDNLVPDVGMLILLPAAGLSLLTEDSADVTSLDNALKGGTSDSIPYRWQDVRTHFGIRLAAEPGWDPPRYRLTPAMLEELQVYCTPAGFAGPEPSGTEAWSADESGLGEERAQDTWQSTFVGLEGSGGFFGKIR